MQRKTLSQTVHETTEQRRLNFCLNLANAFLLVSYFITFFSLPGSRGKNGTGVTKSGGTGLRGSKGLDMGGPLPAFVPGHISS